MFGKAEPYINHGLSGMFYGFNILMAKNWSYSVGKDLGSCAVIQLV